MIWEEYHTALLIISDLSATQFKTLEDTCINFLKHKLQIQKAVKADISIIHYIF